MQRRRGQDDLHVSFKPAEFPSHQQEHATVANSPYNERRIEEIIRIAAAMDQVQELFQHTAGLVIEQGSMLDRVDTNVESALTGVQRARGVLSDVEDRQRRGLAKRISTVLLAANVVVVSDCKTLVTEPPSEAFLSIDTRNDASGRITDDEAVAIRGDNEKVDRLVNSYGMFVCPGTDCGGGATAFHSSA